MSFLLIALNTTAERAVHPEAGSELPQILYTTLSKHPSAYPTFVSATAAVNEDGTLNEKLLHPASKSTLENLLSQDAVNGCIQIEEVWWEEMGVPSRESVQTATQRSDLVARGKVVGKEYGFRFHEPGQLVEVHIEQTYKGKLSSEDLLTFIPVGTFTAGPYQICKIDRRFVQPPEIGDEVLLFVPVVERSDEPYVDLVDGSGLVVLEAQSARMPKQFDSRDHGDLGREEVLDLVQSIVTKPEEVK